MEADRIVLTGEIIFHKIAGYSGGRKSLIPGVAGNRTTTFNHRMVLDPRCRAGVLEGNPSHEDLLEGCRMVAPDFMLNVVLNSKGAVLYVAAGHFEEAHLEGCHAAERLLRTRLQCPYDIVIASAGGAPLNIDLRQAHKGMENACAALRPGGSLYYYAACGDGCGSPMLDEYSDRCGRSGDGTGATRQLPGGRPQGALAGTPGPDIRRVPGNGTHPQIVGRCGFKAVSPQEHENRLQELLGRHTSTRVGVMPHAGITVPGFDT